MILEYTTMTTVRYQPCLCLESIMLDYLLHADRPSMYITRITHLKDHHIASDVASFGSTILPLLVLIWQVKQQIIKVL
ncbi:hypothetical protein BD408DRAFT_64706 [Parasitella parasitica]|nr:hypothetical protein BD408DRAFT_64706 [Parasitella parasitica]